MTFRFAGRWFAALAFGLVAVVLAFSTPSAYAEQGSDSSSYVLDQSTYQQIAKIQGFMSKDQYAKAISRAKDLLPHVANEGHYAVAVVNQLIAQCYLLMKNFDAAEGYLEKVVALNALQPRAERSAVYQLATIYLSQNKYDKSIGLYKQVLSRAEAAKKSVNPALYYRLGLAYSFAGKFPLAYENIHTAIVKREEARDKWQALSASAKKKAEEVEPVPRDWYQNLFIVVYKQKKYSQANDIAQLLVAKWPDKKDFWMYCANTFLLMKEDKKATAVYALMYQRGLFSDKDEYLQLVSLYNEEGLPYQAASLLGKALQQGVVPKSEDNYSLLATLWMQAKEWDDALAALGKQAAIAPSGDIYLRQASIFMSRFQFEDAENAARQAIHKGGLDDPGQAWMILGQAAFRANNAQTALNAFHKAENYSKQKNDARSWIKFVESSQG